MTRFSRENDKENLSSDQYSNLLSGQKPWDDNKKVPFPKTPISTL